MAKAPVCGSVKTRLGREIGPVQATSFYRSVMRNVLLRLMADPRFETELAIAPDEAVGSGFWPAHIRQIGQGHGDLGARMKHIMARDIPGPMIIVGTDIPCIKSEHIAQAFHLLGRHDAVFGRAGDGGYWLVGLRRSPKILDIFSGVRWSTEHALDDTLANLEGRSVGYAATLGDVDCGADFTALGERGRRLVIGSADVSP